MQSLQLNEFKFEPLAESDYPLLLEWLKAPHMHEHWNPVQSIEDVQSQFNGKICNDLQQAYIVSLDGKKFAYIQNYRASKVGGGWWPNEADTTVGIDQFIGDASFLDRGVGTRMVCAFSDWLLTFSDNKKIITDPAISNLRAIRCYQKAGFRELGEIDTPDGKELLMVKALDNKN
jgi:RimJ/RimL family protein N-acetyltransferase